MLATSTLAKTLLKRIFYKVLLRHSGCPPSRNVKGNKLDQLMKIINGQITALGLPSLGLLHWCNAALLGDPVGLLLTQSQFVLQASAARHPLNLFRDW